MLPKHLVNISMSVFLGSCYTQNFVQEVISVSVLPVSLAQSFTHTRYLIFVEGFDIVMFKIHPVYMSFAQSIYKSCGSHGSL